MRVLVAFERSGVVRDAFLKRGHDAWSCDLELCDKGPERHIQRDAMEVIGFNRTQFIIMRDGFSILPDDDDTPAWDLIIMHPPCTALTVAGNHVYAKGKPKHQERLDALEFIDTLWAIANLASERVCMENPQGVIHTNLPRLPKPQYIQPYDFGDDASKKTGLTLRGLPTLVPTNRISGRVVNGVERWANQTDSGQNRLGPSPERAKMRSQTYQGIADAMAEQWG